MSFRMVKAPFIVAAGSQVNAEKLVSLLERTAASPSGHPGAFWIVARHNQGIEFMRLRKCAWVNLTGTIAGTLQSS